MTTGDENPNEELWREVLTHGESSRLAFLPSSPRCSTCRIPFGGIGGVVARAAGKRPSRKNPTICNYCDDVMPPGGAELDIAILFADVRGSTTLAEQVGSAAFAALLQRFYHSANHALLAHDAIIDKMIGDEAMAYWIPAMGDDYRRQAVLAAQELMTAIRDKQTGESILPVGIGVHAGPAFVGKVGGSGVEDFTALGDTVNTASRLQSESASGEIFISEEIYSSAASDFPDLEERVLTLRGKDQPVPVRVLRP